MITSLDQIDANWQAVHQATLLFVLEAGRVLLIRKKRGLGAGKINGPGGKLDPGESLSDCAIREVQEELGITASGLKAVGRLKFQFIDGYSIDVSVFTSEHYTGTPVETDEAIPLWFDKSDIPYGEMWEDDKIWLPLVLNGETVKGRFVFDEDKMLAHEVLID